MMRESFMRDFFGMRQVDEQPRKYEWVTVQERPSIAANQSPRWADSMFREWIKAGWEVVSVTAQPKLASHEMCLAIGVLRRPLNGGDEHGK